MRGVIIAGIGTDVGKTVVSAAVCQALSADYWKPLASGLSAGPGDDSTVMGLIDRGEERVHPSAYLLSAPLSPHVAAAQDGVAISLDRLALPESSKPLVVELAGGVLVPLSDSLTNMDVIARLDLPVIVVSRHYLGSINHTLLTLEALGARGVPIMGVVFNGTELPDTERIICQLGSVRVLGRVPHLEQITPAAIRSVAASLSFPI